MLPLRTEWILPNGLRGSDLPSPPLAAFPPEIGAADVTFHPLQDGAFVLDVRSHFHIPVTVEATLLFDEPTLAMRLPSAGRARIRNDRATLEESAKVWTISMMANTTCQIDNHPGESYGALVSVFTVSRLRAMLGEHMAPPPVRRFLDGYCDEFDAEVRTSASLTHLATRLQTNPYQGAMAQLYREGVVYQLMAVALTDFAGEAETSPRMMSRDRRRALLARDILMDNLSAPPTIEDLARQVGTSQRRLTEAFNTVFGASPFQCLTQWRLNYARDILASKELSVKQVAQLMGYAHLSSFSHAYARRFGCSPMRHRESS